MECGWVCWALVLLLLADTSRGQGPSCCGDILRPATVTQDQSTGYSVPEGWTLCYLDSRDGEYAGTPCHALLQGIPEYGDSNGLLAAGGSFGCGLGFNDAIGAPPVEPAFTPGAIQHICRDDNREQGMPYFVELPFMTFGVCIRGLTCGGLGDACSDDPCHDQASCAPEATCTCNYGYTGDGRVSGTGCSEDTATAPPTTASTTSLASTTAAETTSLAPTTAATTSLAPTTAAETTSLAVTTTLAPTSVVTTTAAQTTQKESQSSRREEVDILIEENTERPVQGKRGQQTPGGDATVARGSILFTLLLALAVWLM